MNKTIDYNCTSLDLDFLDGITKFYLFQRLHFGSLETVVCMVIFKTFRHLKNIQESMQAIKKTKPKSEGSRPKNSRTVDMRPKQTKQTEDKLKYPESSRSSFFKLVFGNLKPNRGHANKYNSNLYTFMVNLKRLKDNKSPHITHGYRYTQLSDFLSVHSACFLLGRMLFQGLPPIHLVWLSNFLEQINIKAFGQVFETQKHGKKQSKSRFLPWLDLGFRSSPLLLVLLVGLSLSLSNLFFFLCFLSLSKPSLFFSLSLSHGFFLKILEGKREIGILKVKKNLYLREFYKESHLCFSLSLGRIFQLPLF